MADQQTEHLQQCCRVCGSLNAGKETIVRASEAMFGTAERFDYAVCAECDSLNILSLPEDMGRYYPDGYYSFAPDRSGSAGALKTIMRAWLALDGPAALFSGRDWYEKGDLKSLRDAKAKRSSRILDIGCGNGNLVSSLRDIGYHNVSGADPFIASDIVHANGTRIHKCAAADLTGPYDIVMMHHSLEHVWDQRAAAQDIHRLLAPGGRCIIRIPTVDCYAWEEYGPHWVQLDAPRHFTLHSRKSIAQLLERVGLKVTGVIDDSIAFHLLGSEKIRLGHPLIDPETNQMDFEKVLPPEFVATAGFRARELNRQGRGDAIAVHAQKS